MPAAQSPSTQSRSASFGAATGAAFEVAHLAELIDGKPGIDDEAVIKHGGGTPKRYQTLRSLGYRVIYMPGPTTADDRWTWWPSARRCAELARVAEPGPTKERLLAAAFM